MKKLRNVCQFGLVAALAVCGLARADELAGTVCEPVSCQKDDGWDDCGKGCGDKLLLSIGGSKCCDDCDTKGGCGVCFQWGEDTYLSVGAGIRFSYNAVEDGAPNGAAWSNDFKIDNARLYFNGRGHKNIGFEFNTDVNNAQGFQDVDYRAGAAGAYDESGNIRILDAIAKFEFHDLFNIWFGRFLPPSDRSNLDGPFYLNVWDFPFVQFGYPNIFQGRDDGVSVWGQVREGLFKYQLGVFEGQQGLPGDTQFAPGQNPRDRVLTAGRLVLNLLDPEPGYYNQSTYYGEKDILAIGLAAQHQEDATLAGFDFTGWSLDLLFERKLSNCGVVTFEGAYYEFDDNGLATSVRDGESFFILGSYLIPRDVYIGCISGRFSPYVRYQEYDRTNIAAAAAAGAFERGLDVGVHYVMFGHNARVTAVYSQRDVQSGPQIDIFRIGTQLQF